MLLFTLRGSHKFWHSRVQQKLFAPYQARTHATEQLPGTNITTMDVNINVYLS